jgi:prepilin-type N-terminal cleavage/methylation domain-containing protein
MPTRRSLRSEDGFTLIELMVAAAISLVVLSVAFSAFSDAMDLNQSASQIADASQNLRAGTNLFVRDLLQAGRNLPIGGIAIPSGNGSTAIYRPSPPGSSYTFDNVNATTLPAITTGNDLGPTINGKPTDLITILMDDPVLAPLTLSPAGTAGTVPKLSADGSSFSVGLQTSWISGDPANGIPAIKAGDLIYFLASGGTAIQTVTGVTGSTVTFGTDDPFHFNQRGAAAGSITQILGAAMTARRVYMFTYFVHEDTPGEPRLMRMLNQFPPQALAGVVEDLDLDYDLVDGTNNPTDVADLPYTANGVTYNSSQIRKVNLHIGVRSELKSKREDDYLRNHLSTVVALRNLAYVDRYK